MRHERAGGGQPHSKWTHGSYDAYIPGLTEAGQTLPPPLFGAPGATAQRLSKESLQKRFCKRTQTPFVACRLRSEGEGLCTLDHLFLGLTDCTGSVTVTAGPQVVQLTKVLHHVLSVMAITDTVHVLPTGPGLWVASSGLSCCLFILCIVLWKLILLVM